MIEKKLRRYWYAMYKAANILMEMVRKKGLSV